MKRSVTLSVLLCLAGSAGCDKMNGFSGSDTRLGGLSDPGRTNSDPRSAGDDAAGPRRRIDEPLQYTLLLCVTRGPGHVDSGIKAKGLATQGLAQEKDLLLVHKEDRSELYLRRTYSSDEAGRADLIRARTFRPAGAEQPVFSGAAIIPVLPEEFGPREWNLKNAGWQYEYTILVGEFEDSPEHRYVGKRVKDCVEHCRELRKRGFDAYYDHGPVRSLVTVGLFPETSVQQVVIGWQRDRSGQNLPVLGQRIADPQIEKIMTTKSPPLFCLAWNGHVQYHKDPKGGSKRVPVGSQVIQIPRSQTEHRKILEMRLRAAREQEHLGRDRLPQPGQVP